jgi:hypothetical protein
MAIKVVLIYMLAADDNCGSSSASVKHVANHVMEIDRENLAEWVRLIIIWIGKFCNSVHVLQV